MIRYHLIDAQQDKGLKLAEKRIILTYVVSRMLQHISDNPKAFHSSIAANPDTITSLKMLDMFMESFPELLDVTQKGIKTVRGRLLYGRAGFEMHVVDKNDDQATVIVITDPGALKDLLLLIISKYDFKGLDETAISTKLSGLSLRINF